MGAVSHPPSERDAVNELVAGVIASARGRGGGALLIEGDAGLGKTTLLESARHVAEPGLRFAATWMSATSDPIQHGSAVQPEPNGAGGSPEKSWPRQLLRHEFWRVHPVAGSWS
jgi:hypothetical protein